MCLRSVRFFSTKPQEEITSLLEIVIDETRAVSLPSDVMKEILQKLDWNSIIQFSQVDKWNNALIKKCFNDNPLISDLFEKYTRFTSELESKQRIHRRMPSFFTDNSPEAIDHRRVTVPIAVFIGLLASIIVGSIVVGFAISPPPNDRLYGHFLGEVVGILCGITVFIMMGMNVGILQIEASVADNVAKMEELTDQISVLPEVIKDKIGKMGFIHSH